MNVMLKPVSGSCNLDCKYCFYKRDHICGGLMTLETAKTVIDRMAFFLRGGYPLVFQGGEPLLAGYHWFESVFAFLEVKGLQPQILIQTNGTLIDEAYAKLFADHGVLVGVSLDGNERNHNHYRERFDAVMRGIEWLRKYKCDFNVVTVVTDELCQNIDEVYEFYRREQFEYQQYIPCMAPMEADPYQYLTEQNYGEFLVKLYDLWRTDYEKGRYVYIRWFENILQILAGYWPEQCGAGGLCSEQYLVEYDGSVYPCDFFVEEQYQIGNFISDSLEKIRKKQLDSGFVSAKNENPKRCIECEFWGICRGGCKRYRDDHMNYVYCKALKHFFSHRLADMEKLLQLHHCL